MIIFKAVLYLQKKVRKDFYSGYDKILKKLTPFQNEIFGIKRKVSDFLNSQMTLMLDVG